MPKSSWADAPAPWVEPCTAWLRSIGRDRHRVRWVITGADWRQSLSSTIFNSGVVGLSGGGTNAHLPAYLRHSTGCLLRACCRDCRPRRSRYHRCGTPSRCCKYGTLQRWTARCILLTSFTLPARDCRHRFQHQCVKRESAVERSPIFPLLYPSSR